jgi:precorrin-2/cobalt-factor-2 C20-methyltransferase
MTDRATSAPGTLYGLGVGPGDPELMTLKAARVLREVDVLAVPVAQKDGDSYALTIAEPLLRAEPGSRPEVVRLHFPMIRSVEAREQHRRAAARSVAEALHAGRDVAFLTEGDPLLHSTFIYVLRHLPGELPVTVVPGVSSVMAAAAQVPVPLVNGDQRLALMPATFEAMDELRRVLRDFDTVVLLKVHRVLDQLLDLLEAMRLLDEAVLIERASHEAGRVVRDVRTLRGAKVHYLSLLIVRGGRDGRPA